MGLFQICIKRKKVSWLIIHIVNTYMYLYIIKPKKKKHRFE